VKRYTIKFQTESEKEEIENRITRIRLKERLDIRHPQIGPACPLEATCTISNGNHMVSAEYKKAGFITEGLLIQINEEKPRISANDCKNFFLIPDQLASIVFDDVLVLIYFENPRY